MTRVGPLHPGSILFSGLGTDNFFSNACEALHLDVMKR